MPRPTHFHECSNCGARATKWSGRCPGCGEWNTLVEKPVPQPGRPAGDGLRSRLGSGPDASAFARLPAARDEFGMDGQGLARSLGAIQPGTAAPFLTGLAELDRVLAGGIVPGSVTLLGGEPGIGKSTLALQAMTAVASQGRRALMIAAEESAEQVRRRADRLGALPEQCYVLSTGNLLAAIEAADQVRPSLLVIDSVQAIGDPSISSAPGSPNQVRECAQLLAQYAKATSTALILVGHVTKDGALAGPRTLEHLVDTVLSFEGDRHYALRALVAVKHRFGPAGELGLFEMTEDGLADLADPSRLLLGDRREDAAGSVAVPVVEGRRPLVVEVQALLALARAGAPRRVAQGVSPSRLTVLLAVLERCCGYRVGTADVFVSTVGGIKVTEPASDLAVALAVCSGLTGIPLPADTVVFGEVGLSGEVRRVPGADRRLAEAKRLGFRRVVGPDATPESHGALRVDRVRTVAQAVELLGFGLALEKRTGVPPGAKREAADRARRGSPVADPSRGLPGRPRTGSSGQPGRPTHASHPHLVVLAPLEDSSSTTLGDPGRRRPDAAGGEIDPRPAG